MSEDFQSQLAALTPAVATDRPKLQPSPAHAIKEQIKGDGALFRRNKRVASALFPSYNNANQVTQHTSLLNHNSDYAYDPTGQLAGVSHYDGDVEENVTDESYAYDANGNRTLNPVEAYAAQIIGDDNRLLDDRLWTYVYDAEGNLTSKTQEVSGEYIHYTWDHRNRLVEVDFHEWGDGVTGWVTYQYDAFNQLIGRQENLYPDMEFDGPSMSRVGGGIHPDSVGEAPNPESVYVYDNGQMVLQFDGWYGASPTAVEAIGLAHRYLWGPAVDQLLADENVADLFDAEANDTLWAITDRQGSVTDTVDNNSTQRLHRIFDSFGNITSQTFYDSAGDETDPPATWGVSMVIGYTGRPLDTATGQQNNGARWYVSATGRWMSQDPIPGNQTNLYPYVGNSPTNYTDPSGMAKELGIFWGSQFYITTQQGTSYTGSAHTELLGALNSIQAGGETIDTMVCKAHGANGNPFKGNGPWMQSGDGFTLIGFENGKIIIDDEHGYPVIVTGTMQKITNNKSKLRLRGCNTAVLAGAISGTLHNGTEVSGAPTKVVNIPFTYWIIGPWGSF